MRFAALGRGVVLTAEAINEENEQWIEVLPIAEKARNGRWFFTVTADDLETYAAYIRDHAGTIQVDYDHEGAEGKSTRAAGWFTGEAKVDGEKLIAQVRWTPKARQEIEDGEFRFVSPEFSFKEKDRKTGLMTKAKEIIAATLTNRPFFTELAALASTIAWSPDEGFQRQQELVNAQINSAGGEWRYWVMDIASGKALIRENATSRTWVATFTIENGEAIVAAVEDWIEAEQEWVQAALDSAQALKQGAMSVHDKGDTMENTELQAIATALGLDADADTEAVVASVGELKAKAESVPDPEALKVLMKRAEAGENALTRIHAMERENCLSEGVRTKRIDPAEKDALAELYDIDPEKVKNLIAARAEGSFKPLGKDGSNGELDEDPTKATVKVQDREIEVDPDTAALDAAAWKILDEKGVARAEATAEQYLDAVDKAAKARAEA